MTLDPTILQFAKEFGLFGTMVMVFTYWSWVREQKLSARVTTLETFVEKTLMRTIETESAVITKCSIALEHTADTLQKLTEAATVLEKTVNNMTTSVSFRPCLLPDDHPAKQEAARALMDAYNSGRRDRD